MKNFPESDETPKPSSSNTRDNFVRHALTHKTCPVCSKPLVDRVPLTCPCGFTVSKAELERHL